MQESGELDALRLNVAPPQRREHDQGQRLRVLRAADLLAEHQAIHVGHLHIQNGYVERNICLHVCQRFLARSIGIGQHAPGLRL